VKEKDEVEVVVEVEAKMVKKIILLININVDVNFIKMIEDFEEKEIQIIGEDIQIHQHHIVLNNQQNGKKVVGIGVKFLKY